MVRGPGSGGGHDFRQLASRQLADYDAVAPGSLFAGSGPGLTVDEAYRLQLETVRLRRARGESLAGYKIGCVSEGIRRQLGVEHPVFGHVFLSEVHLSPVCLDHASFCSPAIEGEIAVTLRKDIESLEHLRAAPERYVRDMFPVIELHNYFFRGAEPSAAELIANNALHAGIVRATGTGAIGAGKAVRVQINGETHESKAYDPCATLWELASRLAVHGIKPCKGDLLLTGSPLPLYAVSPGDSVTVNCAGVPPVTASFEPD